MDPTVDSDGDGNFTNDMDGDGIWDTTAIVVGLHHNPSVTGSGKISLPCSRISKKSLTTVPRITDQRT